MRVLSTLKKDALRFVGRAEDDRLTRKAAEISEQPATKGVPGTAYRRLQNSTTSRRTDRSDHRHVVKTAAPDFSRDNRRQKKTAAVLTTERRR